MRISSAIFFVLILFSFSSCEFLGFRLSKVRSTPDSKDKSADPAGVSFLTAGEKLKFHRWLVLEMYEQVFGHPMKDKSEATGWANVLSQRGSIEGVYHGFVYSKEYSDLENGKAKLPAIRFFSTEMAILDHPNKAESSDEIKNAAEKYASENMAVPFFTLKKQLGDRIIKEAVARKEDKSKISFGMRPWQQDGLNTMFPWFRKEK
ncbi:MAG: hypothetical protein M9962_12880 [Oligoflexia bacterium]|nr:hypothetical protein [Oligoflexia bacterium]